MNRRQLTFMVILPGLFLVAALFAAGRNNQHMLNTDAVAYLRIASYYANGQTDLMISGYWGPLLSWLIVPGLKLGLNPLVAARMAMAFSAMIFWAGSIVLFRAFRMSNVAQSLGSWLTAFSVTFWSVEYIAPDLLVSGLMAFGISLLQSRKAPVVAGLSWAAAYYAKAIAFPFFFILTVALAFLWIRTKLKIETLRPLVLALSVFLIVSAPWITLLSVRYKTLTISTTARIAHAVIGPPDQERYHPFARTLHQPEPGRISSWEDPTGMSYAYWSPFENKNYARHQINLIAHNLRTEVQLLARFDWWHLGLVSATATLVLILLARLRKTDQPWPWAWIPLACLMTLYLPVYLQPVDQRYFYLAYPLLLMTGFGATELLASSQSPVQKTWCKTLLLAIFVFSFGWLAWIRFSAALEGLPNPAGVAAQILAQKLEAAQIKGPIAGSGQIAGGRTGLFLAYFLDQQWYGDEARPSPDAYARSEADLIVVNRKESVAAQLDLDQRFKNLDPLLFSSPEDAAAFPLQVYQKIAGL